MIKHENPFSGSTWFQYTTANEQVRRMAKDQKCPPGSEQVEGLTKEADSLQIKQIENT